MVIREKCVPVSMYVITSDAQDISSNMQKGLYMQMYVRVVGIVISVTGWVQEHALHKFRKAYL